MPLQLPVLAETGTTDGTQVGAAVFLADTAENGAGYAVELGKPELFAAMLKGAFAELRSEWEADEHAAKCDTSCPDCLRSYNNSRRHGLLDWRLALDMLELVIGEPMETARSLPSEGEWMDAAANGLGGASKVVIEGVPAIVLQENCVLLRHPLWRPESAYFATMHRASNARAEKQFRNVVSHDLREFRRNPISIWQYLQ
jgi:DEAD/DEAH box helicase domain-containing protein